MDRYNKLYNEQVKTSTASDPEKSIKNKMKSYLQEAYNQKELIADEVTDYLNKAGIEFDSDLFDEWDYKNETGATSYSKYSRLKDAITDSYENGTDRTEIKNQINKLLNDGVEVSSIKSTITSTYKPIYLENKSAALKNLLITCYMYCGDTRDEAIKKIDDWSKTK